ncbi:MAG: SUMF1/EgtB/PvdO family nonheme iron enzyme [Armatimonadota bacterium]|nr:SUMF1/EgtB/PvdO family nonheme iron enzyme [Armatimonadota bacterium]
MADELIESGLNIEWVRIPAGAFLYGDTKERRELDTFDIMKHPVTVAQYRQFCEATDRKMPNAPNWGWQDSHPIVNITWYDAAAFAEWVGASLPTEAQWEKAARGTDGREYPWGNEWDASKFACNKESTQPVGSYASGASPYGCMDMAGNVWEWCADWYDSSKRARVLRGGSWGYYDSSYRCADRDGSGPSYDWGNYGFRLAR